MDQTPWMKGRGFRRAVLLLCLITAVASAECDNSDLAGVWIVKTDGLVVKPESAAGPFARAGLLTAEEDGTVTLVSTTTDKNGIIFRSATGRYEVNPDCTAEVRVETGYPSRGTVSERYAGVLGNNGRELTFLLTHPSGTTIRMNGARLRDQSCGLADVRGRFVMELDGWEHGSPIRRLGLLTADGEGSFRAELLVSAPAGGEVPAETLTGTYSVTEECAFEFRTSVREVGSPATGRVQAPFPAAFRGAGFDSFERAALVQDSPGAVVSGTLTRERILLGTTPPPAQLLLSTTSLTFTASASSPSRSAAFSYSLSDSGSRPVTVQGAAQSGGWLSAQPSGANTPGSVTVSINASGLAPGTYAGSVTVSVSGVGSGVIGVVLTVTGP